MSPFLQSGNHSVGVQEPPPHTHTAGGAEAMDSPELSQNWEPENLPHASHRPVEVCKLSP